MRRVGLVSTLGVAAGLSLAMRGSSPTGAAATGGTTARGQIQPASAAPGSRRDRAARVLVYHDMEGLSGQSDWRTFSFAYPERYKEGRELLIADVNAVIDGLFAGGATEVHLVDAHGSGNPDPDVPADRLDKRAKQVLRDQSFRQYVDLVAPNVYDAVAVVGMHAKTGSRGFASHTYTVGMEIILHGKTITETELVGYSWGRVGVPVIFASGDDRLREDLRTMPWIEYVVTKKATSASTAEPRPVAEVRAELKSAAKRAVENLSKMQAMKIVTPVEGAVRVVPPASLAALRGVPGVRYSENRVDFTVPDFGAAYDAAVALIGVATRGYATLLTDVIRRRPEGGAIMLENTEALFTRWFDVESGRWTAPPPPSPPAGKKYHGAQ